MWHQKRHLEIAINELRAKKWQLLCHVAKLSEQPSPAEPTYYSTQPNALADAADMLDDPASTDRLSSRGSTSWKKTQEELESVPIADDPNTIQQNASIPELSTNKQM
jgi:hypothetical protein